MFKPKPVFSNTPRSPKIHLGTVTVNCKCNGFHCVCVFFFESNTKAGECLLQNSIENDASTWQKMGGENCIFIDSWVYIAIYARAMSGDNSGRNECIYRSMNSIVPLLLCDQAFLFVCFCCCCLFLCHLPPALDKNIGSNDISVTMDSTTEETDSEWYKWKEQL